MKKMIDTASLEALSIVDSDNPHVDIITDTLPNEGNLFILGQLLDRIRSGQVELLEQLAAMKLENADILLGEIPEPPKDARSDVYLWYALSIARMGNFQALDNILHVEVFLNNTQTLYDRIAKIRPVPAKMYDHLLNTLPSTNQFFNYGIKSCIVWAVTGIANADGKQIIEDKSETDYIYDDEIPIQGEPATDIYDEIPKMDDNFQDEPKTTEQWFNNEKGYGFTQQENGGADVFIHLPQGGIKLPPLHPPQPIDDKEEIGIIEKKTTAKKRAVKSKTKPRAKSKAKAASATTVTIKEEPTDERRVNVQIIHNEKRRKTFVGGVKNIIRCWIGMPERKRAAVSDKNIPFVDAIPEEGLKLTVMLRWKNNESKEKILWLPADRSARSGDCNLEIDIPEKEHYVRAKIMFQYQGYAYEAVRVEADVLAPNEQEDPNKHNLLRVQVDADNRRVTDLKERNENNATFIYDNDHTQESDQKKCSPSILQVFGSKGVGEYDLSNVEPAVKWLTNELFITNKSLVRSRAQQGESDAKEILDTEDQDMLEILYKFAHHGTNIYKELLDQNFVDPGERIQLLNKTAAEYVPLEFIYDRGPPAINATLCKAGLKALESDENECPTCKHIQTPYRKRAKVPVICPLGFWSLQKIIERKDFSPDGGNHSFPSTGQRILPAIDTLLFASSNKVLDEDRMEIWKNLEQNFEHPIWANDWKEWKEALKDNQPPLLLILPHHGVEYGIDYLEIGGNNTPKDLHYLMLSELENPYTNPKESEPGPIVVLLGCKTASQTKFGYKSPARKFQKSNTSIVVGTLSNVLGRNAAPVARELVSQLAAVNDPEADFSAIMRRVRRRMFAKGYLMALCLVALGDSGWQLKPRPDTDTIS